jgi:hypothetical protein
MVERGIISLTEVSSVIAEHQEKVVAVESSPLAVGELQAKYPGMKILETDYRNLVRGTNPLRWPTGADEKYCKARIINLDLDESLAAITTGGQIEFPLLSCVQKFAQLHANARMEWVLCLTLHAQINWTQPVSTGVQQFLNENFDVEPDFEAECRALIGAELCDLIKENRDIDFSTLREKEQQAIMMAFVPKKVSHLVVNQGWLVTTVRNLRYGGPAENGVAPMVTWVMRFSWDTRASRRPRHVYRESLKEIFNGAGTVAEDGTIS